MTFEAPGIPRERPSAPHAVLRVVEVTKSFRRGPPRRRNAVKVLRGAALQVGPGDWSGSSARTALASTGSRGARAKQIASALGLAWPPASDRTHEGDDRGTALGSRGPGVHVSGRDRASEDFADVGLAMQRALDESGT